MKILYLQYGDVQSPWMYGGGATRTYEVCKRLVKKHSITVITGDYPSAKNCVIEGIKYKRARALYSKDGYWWSRMAYSEKVREYLEKEKYDIVVDVFSPTSPTYSYKYSKTKVIVMATALTETWKQKLLMFISGKLLSKYKYYIAVSRMNEDNLRKYIKNGIGKVIYNGIDNNLFIQRRGKEKYFLYLGRLEYYNKGLDILLKAVRILREKGIYFLVKIAGEGKKKIGIYDYRLLYNLKDCVQFVGKVEGKEKKKLLRDCIAVVQPSRYETWGLTCIEAGASKKPVIANNIDGLQESVLCSYTGEFFKKNDPKSLAKKMELILNNKMWRQQLGDNGFKYSQHFTWNKCATDYENVLEEACDGS